MPELPDIELYLWCLQPRVVGHPIERMTITSPFVVRSVAPSIDEAEGQVVRGVRRVGKRIVFELDDDLFLVVHLMIAGRFRWYDVDSGKSPPARSRLGLAALRFPTGTLWLTEAGTHKRASLHLVRGASALAEHDRGGLDVMTIDRNTFAAQLTRENHTLKRALCDPRLFSGIGNAYSDEILHAARLSPLALTARLSEADIDGLYAAVTSTLETWSRRLREEFADRFPGRGDVTAFRPDMAVHGRFGKACPVCATPVQRIVYAQNETNYCPACQTKGRVLADRSLSRLLRDDWPRSIDELELHDD